VSSSNWKSMEPERQALVMQTKALGAGGCCTVTLELMTSRQDAGLASRAPLGGPQQQIPGLNAPLAVEHEAAPHELAQALVQLRHQVLPKQRMTSIGILLVLERSVRLQECIKNRLSERWLAAQ